MTKYYPQGLSYFSAILGRPGRTGWLHSQGPKGLPTYWTLATEFSYWRLPADTYNRTTTKLPSSDPKFTPARAIIKRQLPSACGSSWGGWIVTLITLLREVGV